MAIMNQEVWLFILTNARCSVAHLERFYAVTVTGSVYCANIGTMGKPTLTKIRQSPEIKSGWKAGQVADNGTMLSVAKNLTLFIYEIEGVFSKKNVLDVPVGYRGAHTSYIVALFLKEEAALECSKSPNLMRCYDRWKQ